MDIMFNLLFNDDILVIFLMTILEKMVEFVPKGGHFGTFVLIVLPDGE